jgi:membrane protein YdbS with pleckstrin-like domain
MSLSPIPDRAPAAERVIARVRPHARALFWPTILLIVVCAALGYSTSVLTVPWQSLAALGIGVALIIVGWLMPLFFWLARNYTITSRRTVLRSGVFVRSRQEVLHSRTVDVTVRKGAAQTLFGTGDVLLNVGTHRPVVLRDVPSPDLVASALHELIDQTQPDRLVG